ncbi:MAG: DUF1349 domain-containing protein [Treponema sp.]|nr:DUF1349 domain-containing protein [Treponema sp.]
MKTEIFKDFKWENKTDFSINKDSLIIRAHPHSDFFISPAGDKRSSNAAFFYTETDREFILKAKVTHAFKSVFDACTLMVYSDESCWAKFCFELTDFGSHSVVSVVTRAYSDDCNGVKIEGNTVWLQITRKGKLFGFHYSLDGINFEKVRYFNLPVKDTVRAGFVGQSPSGDGAEFVFEDIALDFNVTNVRSGC